MKQRGFILIEIMIAVVIVLTVILMTVNIFNSTGTGNSISYGYNGMTESRCIDGYKFIVSQDGGARQIMDELGKGVKC
jgi:hypothetical protein